MRKDLLGTFDKIYILDLHGNSRKKESIPDDGRDENVFDIQQGVSINIFVKIGSKGAGDFAGVFHCDLYGKRAEKYSFLLNNTINSIAWKELPLNAPQYFFVPKNFGNQKEYEEGFSMQELFTINSSGVKTHDDANLVDFSPFPEHNQLCDYRPFDTRYINYDLKKVKRHRYEVMQHFLKGENVGLITCRQQSTFDFQHILLSKHIIDMCAVSSQTKETGYIFPLYLYPESGNLDGVAQRRPNLNKSIVDEIAQRTGLRFVEEDDGAAFAPINLLDYIYTVLYSNNYRAKYKELLKIDFPRVPYPENKETFQELSKYGATLQNLHLLEHVEPLIDTATYPIEGNNCIDQIAYKNGNVYINKTQYFEHISLEVWEYYIGGYQPAQKWLKDRKERELDYDDISHYQKIITALSLTIDVQAHIDAIIK
jgi:predicted helicase